MTSCLSPIRRRWLRRLTLCGILLGLGAGPGQAQGLAKRDTKAPIEITANELTVRQQENQAVFKGDVDAVQGDMSLKAQVLTVFYAQQAGAQATPATGGDSIQRIEAQGQVLLASPEQSAAGDRGVYDVPARKITLFGNVILTGKGNVIRGARLDYDLASGVAVVAAGAPEGGRNQRVRALFEAKRER